MLYVGIPAEPGEFTAGRRASPRVSTQPHSPGIRFINQIAFCKIVKVATSLVSTLKNS
jgi:hypothetical protein